MLKLFGTDGIRGRVGESPLTPEFFLRLGQAAGKVLKSEKKSSVIIGRDTRQSGIMLQNAITAGLLSSSVDIIDLGVIPTAAVSWMVSSIKAEAGIVISASHNPVQENGIKFFDQFGQKLNEKVEQEIENLLFDENFHPTLQNDTGRYVDGRSFEELYSQDLLTEHPANFLRGLTIVIDCSHGAASHVAPDIFQRAGANIVVMNASPTGLNINFNSGSEYVRRFPEKFHQVIKQNNANFGLAFDGDADRVVFVDEDGTLIDGDHMLGFLSRYLEKRGALLENSVVTTNMRNEGLKRYVESQNIQMYETPVGDKYVIEKLMQFWNRNAEKGKVGLGGEQAGHIILLDEGHITGDGLRTALFVMNAYIESGYKTLASFAAGVGKMPQIIASAQIGAEGRYDKQQLQAMENEALSTYPGLLRANLRYSGTEPLFRIMLESENTYTERDLAKIAIEISRKAQEFSKQPNGYIDILNCTRGGVVNMS
jgi:phosphoglucosamine mutase